MASIQLPMGVLLQAVIQQADAEVKAAINQGRIEAVTCFQDLKDAATRVESLLAEEELRARKQMHAVNGSPAFTITGEDTNSGAITRKFVVNGEEIEVSVAVPSGTKITEGADLKLVDPLLYQQFMAVLRSHCTIKWGIGKLNEIGGKLVWLKRGAAPVQIIDPDGDAWVEHTDED